MKLQNRTEKQIIPSKITINGLFNDIWCYLFIACFDWKIAFFQQTVRVNYILNNDGKKIYLNDLRKFNEILIIISKVTKQSSGRSGCKKHFVSPAFMTLTSSTSISSHYMRKIFLWHSHKLRLFSILGRFSSFIFVQ